jgi:hypothetical protein
MKTGLFLIGLLAASGCGYHLRETTHALRDQHGVQSVYVEPLKNRTYKTGVENHVYNALMRVIAAGDRIRLVRSAEEADAILSGNVSRAEYGILASTTEEALLPKSIGGRKDVQVATVYQANLACEFNLRRRGLADKTLWSSNFSRAKPFASQNQLGTLGRTSALINESEFERALQDLTENMVADVHESMLAGF